MVHAKQRVTDVLIVEDHPVLVHGLKEALDATDQFRVVATTDNEAEAVRLASEHKPDVAIVDLTLPGGSGLSTIRLMTEQDEKLRVLVFTMHDEMLYAERAMRAGAHGYVQKSADASELMNALRAVASGKTAISDSLNERLVSKALGNGDSGGGVEALSDRELEVFEQIGRGKTLHDIADRLGISVKTIETHRENIKKKLGLGSAAELARFAVAWVENPG
jgi:DNA-binding NarL/FixJ family response regulator